LYNPFFVSERLGSILGTKDFVRILKYPQGEATLTFISSSPKSLTTLEWNHSCRFQALVWAKLSETWGAVLFSPFASKLAKIYTPHTYALDHKSDQLLMR